MHLPVTDPAFLESLKRELHVWVAYPDQVDPQQLTGQFLPLLNQEEHDRFQRFHFDKDRYTYLAAHAVLRIALSRYAAVQPQAWRFVRGPQGKPEIQAEAGLPVLRSNLSHTKGMVACVISLDRTCGVDVECRRSMKDMYGVADVVFSSAEVAYLNTKTEAEWPEDFFTFWTLKEAYIKAIGQGLSAPLKKITFDIEASPIRATFDGKPLGGTGWQFHHWQPTATHHVAVAAQSPDGSSKLVYHQLNLANGLQDCLRKQTRLLDIKMG